MKKFDLRSWAGYETFKSDKKEFIKNVIMVVCGVLCMGITLGFLHIYECKCCEYPGTYSG